MIRLVEVAEFNWLKCPIDRNRELLANYFSSAEFEVVALSNQSCFPEHIIPIHTGQSKVKKIISYLKLALTKGDVLHTRAWPECIPILFLWKMRNPKGKQVLTIHGLPNTKLTHLSGMLLAKLATKVTVVSKITQHEVKKYYDVDSIIIYNGVDTEKFRPSIKNNKRLKILYVGRLESYKNPDYVLQLALKFPECDFYLYGEGSMKQDLIGKSSISTNVFIEGAVPFEKIPSVYPSSDIFLFPTIREGFAMMLEAGASGLPIVCFNATSMPEFVDHGINGYLANDENEMEDYLRILIEDIEKRNLFSKNIRRKAERFDWHKIAEQYQDLYLGLFTKKSQLNVQIV
ncbi:MAG: glycosyltransferase family 4 protein [Methanolobus sp.]